MVLTKKHQKKLKRVTKLADIVTSALAVSKTNVSKALNDGQINKLELTMLQMFYLKALNKLANVDRKMKAEARVHLQKSMLEEINHLKKVVSSA